MTTISGTVATTRRTWICSIRQPRLKKCLIFIAMLCAALIPRIVKTLRGRININVWSVLGFLLNRVNIQKIMQIFSKTLEIPKSVCVQDNPASFKVLAEVVDPNLAAARTVAECVATHDLESAKDMLEVIQDPHLQAEALIEIIKAEAMDDLKAAKATAQSIENRYWQAMALVGIAEVDPMHDLTDAITAAGCITEPFFQDNVFVSILKIQAMHDLEAAKNTLEVIRDPDLQVEALMEIMKAQAI